MAKLALAAGDGSQLGEGWATLRVAARTGREAYRNLGAWVLVHRVTPRETLSFLGAGRVEGVDHVSAETQSCRLADYRVFAAPVPGDLQEVNAPGVTRYLSLTDVRFDAILKEARVDFEIPGADDARFDFIGRPGVDAFLEVRAEVLRRWDYRCCVTETQFAPGEAPELRMVAIRPSGKGGQLVAANYLPMIELAERAWLTGAIAVTENMDFVAVMDRLNPDLLEVMPQSGKLLVPEAPEHAPSRDSLAWHRANVFGR